MMTKDGMYCTRCEQRVTGQGSIYRRRSIRYHCPLCSGPVQTRTVIGSPGVGVSYDTRTFFPDGRALRPDDPPALTARPLPPQHQREPMDSTAWAGIVVLTSLVVTVIGLEVF